MNDFTKYKNYDEYLENGNDKLIVDRVDIWGRNIKDIIDSDYFKLGFKKDEVIKYKVLDRKFRIKYDFDEEFRNKINDKILSKYDCYENEISEYLIKDYGVIKKIKLKEDVEIDMSLDDRLGFDGFIDKYKNSVFNNYKVDFYNYVKFIINYNSRLRNKGKSGLSDKNIYDRNFYKVLIMRILFTQNYIIDGMKMNDVDRDVVNELFGIEGKYFIEKIKGFLFKNDEFGNRKKYNNDEYKESYKNISKVLSVIEGDVMNYLIKRVFSNVGIVKNEFYVNIFDGFLIKKKNYELLKCELNMILRNEVGYMFYMK